MTVSRLRTIFLIYCLLAILFSGGCVLFIEWPAFSGIAGDPRSVNPLDLPLSAEGWLLVVSFVGNLLFIVLERRNRHRDGNRLVAAGIVYAAVQIVILVSLYVFQAEVIEYQVVLSWGLFVPLAVVAKGAFAVLVGTLQQQTEKPH